MRTLYVRNFPERLHNRLKELAARNRRSLGAEVITLVDQALREAALRQGRSAALDRIEKRLKRYRAPADATDSVRMLREDRRR
jgi:plasmid stability protein